MLGRSLISQGSKFSIVFDLLSPAWVRSTWQPLIDHAELKPFFFLWEENNYPDEAALCWSSGAIPQPTYSLPNFMKVSMKVDAVT